MSTTLLPTNVQDVPTPCLLLDVEKVKSNCQKMIDTCQSLGVKLRPHMKTHKTVEVGELMTGGSKRCVVVSTLAEAEFFADHGFDDIIYAISLTPDKIDRCFKLLERLQSFHVLVDSQYGIDLLKSRAPPAGKKWSVVLKIDCGGKRSGVLWNSPECIRLAKLVHEGETLEFQGCYCHEGNAYAGQSTDEIRSVGRETAARLMELVKKLKEAGIPCTNFGVGSTPSCSLTHDDMGHVTEFHPGNYAFYDSQQWNLGSCSEKDIAIRVATRVIGVYPEKKQLLVDCGFLGISHDGFNKLPSGGYGKIQGHPELRLFNTTQEIGYIQATEGDLDYEKYPPGSMLFMYPYHACATAAMHPVYYVHSGEKIIDAWRPVRGW